jgi:hypothetical protein
MVLMLCEKQNPPQEGNMGVTAQNRNITIEFDCQFRVALGKRLEDKTTSRVERLFRMVNVRVNVSKWSTEGALNVTKFGLHITTTDSMHDRYAATKWRTLFQISS